VDSPDVPRELDQHAARLPLAQRLATSDTHVILDRTLIHIDRVAASSKTLPGKTINEWYSGKHRPSAGTSSSCPPPGRVPVVLSQRFSW
jgi:hypothetical protein